MQQIFTCLTSERSTAQPASIWTNWTSASRVGRNGSANEFEPVTTNQSFDRHSPSWSTPSYEKEVRLRTTLTVTKQPIRVTWRSAPQSVIGKNITQPKSRAER